jgi:hypothetical protein
MWGLARASWEEVLKNKTIGEVHWKLGDSHF